MRLAKNYCRNSLEAQAQQLLTPISLPFNIYTIYTYIYISIRLLVGFCRVAMRTELEASSLVAVAAAVSVANATAATAGMVMWMQPMAHNRNVCGLCIVVALRLHCDYRVTSSCSRRSTN